MDTPRSPVVTRFAPSPTGFLHIGGARTALFNWLFARHHGGIFRLRIEDTDRKRSTDAAIEAILDGMRWLELSWDGEVAHQFQQAARHAEVANTLLAAGKAYRCFCTPEELDAMRRLARAEGRPVRYDGRWRDRDPATAPAGAKPVIRLKAPRTGEMVIDDLVQGRVTVSNDQLDDMILLRADGSPTYMHAVVVDDHDMEISHVIRGDDHLTNAFRQTLIYQALGWSAPAFAHIPLIHGPDGAKLSKRHGALGVDAYRDRGYLPEALRNYLLRLGWAHGDDEIISTEQAIDWFDLGGVGKSASRFDFAKLDNLNGHYVRDADDAYLVAAITPRLEDALGRSIDGAGDTRLRRGMGGLKMRARNLNELAENAQFYVATRPLAVSPKAAKMLSDDGRQHLADVLPHLEAVAEWTEAKLEASVRQAIERQNLKLGQIAQPLRAALTGSNSSPGLFEVMEILGQIECLARISDQITDR